MSLLIAAAIPVIAFLYVIYKKDTIKEPVGLLFKCFFGGCLSILLTLMLIYLLFPDISFAHPGLNAFYDAFFRAAIPEELAKFLILYWLVWDRVEFDQHYDGIIYAVFVSMGFAFVENILYVFNYGYTTAIMRGIFAVPGHGLCGVCMGYFFSLARFTNEDNYRKYLIYGLLSAIALHGLYDFALMYLGADELSSGLSLLLALLFFFVVGLEWKLGVRSIQKHLEKDRRRIYEEALSEVQTAYYGEQFISNTRDQDEPEANEEYHRRFMPNIKKDEDTPVD